MVQIFEYQDSPIQFEIINGQVMANATLMAKAFGREVKEWRRLPSTIRYIDALLTRGKSHFAKNQIVVSKKGGDGKQGTWIHEKLILNLARWLDVDFELWCDEKIADLLRTGTATLVDPKYREIAKHIERPVQIQNSKDVNAFNFENGGVQAVKEHNIKNCYEHTGRFPNELVKKAKEAGIPSKNRTSGKEVVRYYKPAVAASMSMTDELCKRGQIGVTDAAQLSKPAIPLFEEMIRQGLIDA